MTKKQWIDWKLAKNVFVRVLLDLWVPALIALGIETYNSLHHWKGWLPAFGAFFTTMFFTGAYFGYVQRAKKTVIDQKNHSSVLKKQDALIENLQNLTNDLSKRQNEVLSRFETLRDDLEGLSTGGTGFCYVCQVRTTGTTIFQLIVMVESKYPLQEVSLAVTDFESLPGHLQRLEQTNGKSLSLAVDFNHKAGTLLPSIAYVIDCSIPIQKLNRVRLQVNWQGKNGTWSQRIQLMNVAGNWLNATYVRRGPDEIFKRADDGYPRDNDGLPIFDEYEYWTTNRG